MGGLVVWDHPPGGAELLRGALWGGGSGGGRDLVLQVPVLALQPGNVAALHSSIQGLDGQCRLVGAGRPPGAGVWGEQRRDLGPLLPRRGNLQVRLAQPQVLLGLGQPALLHLLPALPEVQAQLPLCGLAPQPPGLDVRPPAADGDACLHLRNGELGRGGGGGGGACPAPLRAAHHDPIPWLEVSLDARLWAMWVDREGPLQWLDWRVGRFWRLGDDGHRVRHGVCVADAGVRGDGGRILSLWPWVGIRVRRWADIQTAGG